MTVLLIAYHLFLKKEKIHRFNRFYLLFALLLSLVMPFVNIKIISSTLAKPIAIVAPYKEMMVRQVQVAATEVSVNYIAITIWLIYGIVTLILLSKFVININHFIKKIRRNTKIQYDPAVIVLIPEPILPHTFLNYIFINKREYDENTIENELYTHELTHVRQKHTIDILFIELLKTIFWFNPLFYFYKKAIQLNHEFLADEKVVSSYNNAALYQKLLLKKADVSCTFHLASNLTYSITKQRLLMMTKSTSKIKSALLKVVLVPVIIIGLFLFLSLKKVDNTETKAVVNSLSKAIVHPSEQQWNEWKNDVNTTIWINNWQMKKTDLDQFNPAELMSYSENFISHPNSGNPQEKEVFLYTKQGFEDHYNSLEWPKPIEYKEIQNLRIKDGC